MARLFITAAKFVLILVGSFVAGVFIGTTAHYVGFGIWGYGFSRDALMLAALEGGAIGGVFAALTALPCFYFLLNGRASQIDLLWLFLIALVVATAATCLFPALPLVATPAATAITAGALRSRRNAVLLSTSAYDSRVAAK